MDFEKLALELRDHLERSSEGSAIISDFCLPDIAQALLRAHRQGQEEMRERSAKEGRKMGLHYACLSFESTERVVGASNATARIETAIRSLPLTPIEEDKSVAT